MNRLSVCLDTSTFFHTSKKVGFNIIVFIQRASFFHLFSGFVQNGIEQKLRVNSVVVM
jgi:hypothetical protein